MNEDGSSKSLMEIPRDFLKLKSDASFETGLGFTICNSAKGIVAVMSDGAALPFYDDMTYYTALDLILGTPIPSARRLAAAPTGLRYSTRAAALAALSALGPPIATYVGGAGAVPLIYTITLATNTKFHRYIAASTDPRYNTTAGTLSANTYLSPLLDDTYLNSGFAVVGRLALPIPLPATFKFVYEISAGATIQVGTVSPAFGQAGGGVEVRLTATTAARQLSLPQLPEA